jgi:phosphate transport system protein
VLADRRIDDMQRQIDEMAVSIIARRQPMAGDLRRVVTAIHVASDLERVGDMAKQLARRSLKLEGLNLQPKFYNGVRNMTHMAMRQIKAALDAYAAGDAAAAIEVCNHDEEVDAICTSLFRELLTYMMEDPRNISFCIHLMFCAKNIERIGDHATNIAETVFYMIEGQQITDKRPKGDMTNFATTVPGN